MPIYEYVCTKCEKQTEAMQRISDPPLRKCPSCSGKLRKLISNTSFVLKGGGWYKDGYAAPQASAKSDTSASSASPEKKKGKDSTASEKKKAEPELVAMNCPLCDKETPAGSSHCPYCGIRL